jgi:hypothetical protein
MRSFTSSKGSLKFEHAMKGRAITRWIAYSPQQQQQLVCHKLLTMYNINFTYNRPL